MDEEQMQETPRAPLPAPLSAEEPAMTGHETVDLVLARMGELDHLPVAEHVTIFDQAHEGLRRALNEAGQGQPADT